MTQRHPKGTVLPDSGSFVALDDTPASQRNDLPGWRELYSGNVPTEAFEGSRGMFPFWENGNVPRNAGECSTGSNFGEFAASEARLIHPIPDPLDDQRLVSPPAHPFPTNRTVWSG
jgi:hypothetical protein